MARPLAVVLAEELGRRARPGRAPPTRDIPPGEGRSVDKVVAGTDCGRFRCRSSSASPTTTPTSASATAPRSRHAFVSTVKIKQAGFGEVYDTELSFRHWLRTLIERKVLPPSR